MVGMANILGVPMDFETTQDIQQEIRKILPGYYNLGQPQKSRQPIRHKYFSNGYAKNVSARYPTLE